MFLGRNKRKHCTVLIRYELSGLLIRIVGTRNVKIDDSSNIFQDWSHAVASVKHDYDVKLANVEEVNDAADLILGHVRCQDESLKTKSVQKKFDSVCLNNIVANDNCFALHYC